MDADKEKLANLIIDEFNEIQKLKDEKRQIDKKIDMHIEYIGKYRAKLKSLNE